MTICYTGDMKGLQGNGKVPVASKRSQLIFVSVAGLVLCCLLAFVALRPVLSQSTTETKEITEVSGEEKEVIEEAGEAVVDSGDQEASSDDEDVVEAVVEPQVDTETDADDGVADAEPETEVPVSPEASSLKTYSYVARSGDSFVAMARSSIGLYMKSQGLSLSPAERVAGETLLMVQFGSPMLEAGQKVVLTFDEVKAVVDQVQAMGDDELVGWDVFADQVDFDNDNPPEPLADDEVEATSTVQDTAPSGASVLGTGVSISASGG